MRTTDGLLKVMATARQQAKGMAAKLRAHEPDLIRVLRHDAMKRYRDDARFERGLRTIPVDRVSCGGYAGTPAFQYAFLCDDLMRPSIPLIKGAHVELLELADRDPSFLAEPQAVASTRYFRDAMQCVDLFGQYAGTSDPDEIIELARSYVARYQKREPAAGAPTPERPIIVRPIRDSDCYEMVDGHHRAAIGVMRGEAFITARVLREPTLTPLQWLLDTIVWNSGARELYQPLEAPELELKWRIVRKCTDRFALMAMFLDEQGIDESGSFLDVGSHFGWFMHRMRERGMDVYGIERDRLAARVGEAAFDVPTARVAIGDPSRVLKRERRVYDVVSCLSVLHHFVLRERGMTAEDMLSLLDRATRHVLFVDMGQEHEQWFRTKLAGWNPETIRRWILTHSSFKQVIALGPDQDDVGEYAHNYGRMLFACVRTAG